MRAAEKLSAIESDLGTYLDLAAEETDAAKREGLIADWNFLVPKRYRKGAASAASADAKGKQNVPPRGRKRKAASK